MLLILAVVFWITIQGANIPSGLIASLLVDTLHPALKNIANSIGFPWWLSGVLIDGAYLSMAWVVSVMLPPMAIFFPIYTLLEDFGYLPRVAFNMDPLYKKSWCSRKTSINNGNGIWL
jgi:Fe2+ transport system protein B